MRGVGRQSKRLLRLPHRIATYIAGGAKRNSMQPDAIARYLIGRAARWLIAECSHECSHALPEGGWHTEGQRDGH